MDDNNHMARVEQAVRDNIVSDAVIIGSIEYEVTERRGYWERIYYVAWQSKVKKECGTHRVCISSDRRTALFYGNYQMTAAEAKSDLIKRIFGPNALNV